MKGLWERKPLPGTCRYILRWRRLPPRGHTLWGGGWSAAHLHIRNVDLSAFVCINPYMTVKRGKPLLCLYCNRLKFFLRLAIITFVTIFSNSLLASTLFLSNRQVNFCTKFEALKVSCPFEAIMPFPWNSAGVPKASLAFAILERYIV
jgi:hypothetical protein